MAGPYPQYPDPTSSQPSYGEPYPSQPFEAQPIRPAAASVYPGMLPPPVQYPKRRRWWLVGALGLVVVMVAGAAAAIVYALHNESSNSAGGALSSGSAKVAIQNYLDALGNGDYDTVARNTLCGMYDAVKDRKSDQALARLSSDAFRKQFASTQVTSIDKMVFWSPNQAQVLFSMRVVPAGRITGGDEEQAIAQLLSQDNQVLVCSYLLRTAAQY
ncbi:MAG: hypothetical protein JO044_10135 [Mycobacteriaceae bacterium]|nr:hypothetical protein [Mycobacteriaceae bacterium]MBV9639610.1 hypothetical protein [Mycobacteriaceae bacterium]